MPSTLSRFQFNAIVRGALAAFTPTAWSLGLLGGNVGAPATYINNVFLNNGALSDNYGDYGAANDGVGYHSAKDVNGYPTTGSTWFFSLAGSGGLDGQLPRSFDPSTSAPLLPGNGTSGPFGTYLVNYTSNVTNVSTDVTVPGQTLTNWQSLGSNNYSFRVPVPAGTNIFVNFNKPIQFVDCCRDGITPSSVAGEFYPPNIVNAAGQGVARLMDLCRANTATEATWASRVIDYGPNAPANFSWERIARYINAVYSYPGSVCKTLWINIPVKAADAYVTQLATLMQSLLLPGIHLIVEWANEVWNTGTSANPKGYSFDQAFAESWALISYSDTVSAGIGSTPAAIASITATGTGVAVVTLKNNISTYFKQDGVTPFVTNGAVCYAVNQSHAQWSGSNDGTTVSSPQVQIAITTGGALAANQFSYPCGTAATGTMTSTDQIAFLFNVNSTLVSDGLSWNMFDWYAKFQTRRAYQISSLWKAVRPSDEITLGLQQYGGYAHSGNMNFPSIHWKYGNWLGNGTTDTAGLKTWCDDVCIAPYVFPTCTLASYTAGSNVIHNVPFAAYAVAGDSVQVQGGAGISTVVVSGSGTDLVVADNCAASNTGTGIVNYGGIAQVNGYISGNTLTVTSDLGGVLICKGAPIYGNAGLTAGTVVTGYGTYPDAFKRGALTVNNAQTLGSSGSPVTLAIGQADTVATLWAYLLGGVADAATFARTHFYQCQKYGVKADSYEGGPDTSKNFMKMLELVTYGQGGVPSSPVITMGTIVTALLDTWISAGLNRFNYFLISPQAKGDSASLLSANYAINQSFGDPTPAYQALVAYRTKALSYTTAVNVAPGTIQCAVNTYSPNSAIQTTGNAAGMVYWFSNTAARQVDVVFSVAASGNYALLLKGSDSAPTNVDVYLDASNTKAGTITLAASGNAISTSTTPGVQTSAALQFPGLAAGGHTISFRLAAGAGSSPGFKEFSVQPY